MTVTLDEKEARLVLGLINAAGQAGIVSGEGWEEKGAGMIALAAKIRSAFLPPAGAPTNGDKEKITA